MLGVDVSLALGDEGDQGGLLQAPRFPAPVRVRSPDEAGFHHGPLVAILQCERGLIAAREAIPDVSDGAIKILALATETAASLFVCGTYGNSSPRLTGITWGAEDLSAELGSETNREPDGRFTSPYMLARNLSLAAASAARVQAIDTVYADFRNMAGLRVEAEEARRDGFTAKMAIHPAQVAVINEVFTPTREAIETAEAVVAAFAADPSAGVVAIGGVMYDRPHLTRAQRLLARVKPGEPE